jgi:integrase/recombinase XerD
VEGIVGSSPAAAVPSVAGGTRAGLPQGLEAGAMTRLLAECDRRTRMGRRDFAMVTRWCGWGYAQARFDR